MLWRAGLRAAFVAVRGTWQTSLMRAFPLAWLPAASFGQVTIVPLPMLPLYIAVQVVHPPGLVADGCGWPVDLAAPFVGAGTHVIEPLAFRIGALMGAIVVVTTIW